MPVVNNPFFTGNYIAPEFFCNRNVETQKLVSNLLSGNKSAIIAPRRSGKSWLIEHSLRSREIYRDFVFVNLDIYQVRSLREFIYVFGKELNRIIRLHNIKFQTSAQNEFDKGFEDPYSEDDENSALKLEQLFETMENSSRTFILTIDEFQKIYDFPEKGASDLIKSYIQQTRNTRVIIAGNDELLNGNSEIKPEKSILFPGGPFAHSVSTIIPADITLNDYLFFATYHFRNYSFDISSEAIEEVYANFSGVLWYTQSVLATMFNRAQRGAICNGQMVQTAIDDVLQSMSHTFNDTLFRLPPKQKELLKAIAAEGDARNITSGSFVRKHSLTSQSSVQAALKGLIERDYVNRTFNRDENLVTYSVADKFLKLWLNKI